MGKIAYLIFIKLYPVAARLAAVFSEKARLWVRGRANIFKKIGVALPATQRLIWIHCASLGEFEQGRPLLEKLRENYPAHKLLLTFFSPSGYEVRKDYRGADYIFYLPIDSSKNASQFVQMVKPELAIFVKYEFWHYYLHELKKQKVPLLLISGIFRPSQAFFSAFGHFHRAMLSCFTHLFVQNIESVELLRQAGFTNNVSLAGDTRFDRVIEIAERFEAMPAIAAFCQDADVIVAGSTWSEDDKELDHYTNVNPQVKFIIAPHNIGKYRLNECLRLYKNSVLFSSLNQEILAGINTVIIDNIGMLSRLYKYATVAYVGGGFGADGVHNVLEAAVYGKPVVFGPEYEKFFEAAELIETGGAISVANALELEQVLGNLIKKDEVYHQRCTASSNYVQSKKGSTEKILQFIQEKRLLTN